MQSENELQGQKEPSMHFSFSFLGITSETRCWCSLDVIGRHNWVVRIKHISSRAYGEHVIHPEARTQPRLQSKVTTCVQMLNTGRATFFQSSTKAYSTKTNDWFLFLSVPGAGFCFIIQYTIQASTAFCLLLPQTLHQISDPTPLLTDA